MFMDDDDSKTLSKSILDIKTNNGGTNKRYGGHNEQTPSNAPSTRVLLLRSYG